jgi:hypothetical protein
MELILQWYLVFALTTAIAGCLIIVRPSLTLVEELMPDTISYIVCYLTAFVSFFIAAPFLILILFNEHHVELFITELVLALTEDD